MIFRRFVQRFRQQQWGAIATELVIVVIGVFIGMQVDNWNQARVERVRTSQVLDALRVEMRDYIKVQQSFGDQVTKGLAAFDAARAKGEKPPPWFFRTRGSETPPRTVWQVAQQSGLAEMVRPRLMFDLGFFLLRG